MLTFNNINEMGLQSQSLILWFTFFFPAFLVNCFYFSHSLTLSIPHCFAHTYPIHPSLPRPHLTLPIPHCFAYTLPPSLTAFFTPYLINPSLLCPHLEQNDGVDQTRALLRRGVNFLHVPIPSSQLLQQLGVVVGRGQPHPFLCRRNGFVTAEEILTHIVPIWSKLADLEVGVVQNRSVKTNRVFGQLLLCVNKQESY